MQQCITTITHDVIWQIYYGCQWSNECAGKTINLAYELATLKYHESREEKIQIVAFQEQQALLDEWFVVDIYRRRRTK